MPTKATVFCDNPTEAKWFCSLHRDFRSAKILKIGKRGENPRFIDELIAYDRPDIILAIAGKAQLVIEKTREVPTGHNVGQRMARLVRAIEHRVPAIVFFPFDARKHGIYSAMCNLNIRILQAFEEMWKIHNIPIMAINWPIDTYGELIGDGSEDKEIAATVSGYVDSGFDPNCLMFKRARENNGAEIIPRIAKLNSYGRPPPSLQIVPTATFAKISGENIDIITERSLLTCPETVIYNIVMSEDKCRREDPYTGMQFIYDYMYCRYGARVHEKKRNLVLYFPEIRKNVWIDKNPDDANRKSCNWYLTANLLLFKDGCLLLR